MAFSSLLLSVPLIFLFINPIHVHAIHRHSNVSAEVVESICKTTIDSSFCLRTLRSHLHTPTNLRQVAKITIDSANTHAMATEKKIKSAMKTTKEWRKKEGYVACSKEYGDAISALKDASRDVVRGLYGDVKNNAQNAMEEARSCQRKKPADDRVALRQRNENLEKHSSIIIALANQLHKDNYLGEEAITYLVSTPM